MSVCCVIGCTNNFNNNRNVHYYRFPQYKRTDTEVTKVMCLRQRMAWISALKNKSTATIENIEHKRICSAHFVSGERAHVRDITNQDWVPSINLLTYEDDAVNVNNSVTNGETVEFTVSFLDDQSQSVEPESAPTVVPELVSTVVRTEPTILQGILQAPNINNRNINLANVTMPANLSYDTQLYIAKLDSIIREQTKTIEDFKAKLNHYKFDLETFRNNDAKTLYYTGITEFVKLEELYTQIEPNIQRAGHNILTKSQMLILTLMKQRLGLQFKDLGYRFRISSLTARRTFDHIKYVVENVIQETPSAENNILKNILRQEYFKIVSFHISKVNKQLQL